MTKKKFCSTCGTDLVSTRGNPDCSACAPKAPALPYGVRTHNKPRSKYPTAYINDICNWRAFKIGRETPTLVFPDPPPSYYEKSCPKGEVGVRFATLEEAQAFVDAAKAYSQAAEEAYEAAKAVEAAAREVTREAQQARRQAAEDFFASRTPPVQS